MNLSVKLPLCSTQSSPGLWKGEGSRERGRERASLWGHAIEKKNFRSTEYLRGDAQM